MKSNIDMGLHIGEYVETYHTKPATEWYVNIYGIFDHTSPNTYKRNDFAHFLHSTTE
jgi:hypothetical protein